MTIGRSPRIDVRRSARRHTLFLLLAVLVSSASVSCWSAYEQATPILEDTQPRPVGPYRIQPGDEVEIRFFYTPELDVALPVPPDGRISIPLARSVVAAGRTADELADELKIRYLGELEQPEIAVFVRRFADARVHVGGEVEDPGEIPIVGNLNILQALFAAGGTLDSGRLEQVLIVRRRPDGEQQVLVADIESALNGTDPAQNVALLPSDIVYVPRTAIADVNVFVDRYLRQNIPIGVSMRPDFGN